VGVNLPVEREYSLQVKAQALFVLIIGLAKNARRRVLIQAVFLLPALMVTPWAQAGSREFTRGRVAVKAPEGFGGEDEEALVQAMTAGMKTVEDFLGAGEEKVRVKVYPSTGDFTSANKAPWWVGGMIVGDEIQIQPVQVLKRKGILGSTLTHEYAHLLLKKLSGEKGPKWLQEGTALYLAGELSSEPNKPVSWESLERKIEKPFRDRAEAFEAYREARSSVDYLVKIYGRDKFLNLLENLRVGKDINAAMKEAFGKSKKEIEEGYLTNAKG
jgi:hypothetical protein